MARKKAKALPPKMITVYAEILQETDDAILVRCDEDADGVWLPKSQIGYDGERGDESVEIEIPDWLADEKGFYDGMGEPGPVATPEQPVEPKHPDSVVLTGKMLENSDEEVEFLYQYGDEEEKELVIPREVIIEEDFPMDTNLNDSVTVTWGYALEQGLVSEPEETDETPATKRAFGENVKWIKEEKITVSTPLSESEKARLGEEMAALDKEIKALLEERSEVSSRLKKMADAKEEERLELSDKISDGELRTFSCDCLKDYATGEMVWTEMRPPYAEVNRRKMTKEEMQPSLGEGLDFDALGDGAAEEGDAFTAGGMDDESNEAPEAGAEPGEAEDEAPAGDNPETEEQEVA